MEKKTFYEIKNYMLTMIFIFAFVSMGFGFGLIMGMADTQQTFMDKYNMNITFEELNCEQKIIWTARIFKLIMNSINYIFSGFILMLLGCIIELSMKYKLKKEYKPKLKARR